MKDFIETVAATAICAVALVTAWASSASTIARECERLGAFYVGDTVYKCEVKK